MLQFDYQRRQINPNPNLALWTIRDLDFADTNKWFPFNVVLQGGSSTPPTPPAGMVLGENTYLYAAAKGYPDTSTPPIWTPNAAEFLFIATDDATDPAKSQLFAGLPAGRYYLTINTNRPNPFNPQESLSTVTGSKQLQYAIKYVRVDATGTPLKTPGDISAFSIIDDINNYMSNDPYGVEAGYFAPNWAEVPLAHIAGIRHGEPLGAVFIDGTPEQSRNGVNVNLMNNPRGGQFNPSGYYLDGGPDATMRPALYPTHTVTIPPRNSGWALCVAVRIDPRAPANQDLAINSFDFSQEPDHEYVELANTSDDTVDLSGWQLEIGIPDPVNANKTANPPKDPYKSIWQVPAGTSVAPHGQLLLSFESDTSHSPLSKFDRFQDPLLPPKDATVLNTNGIGLEGLTSGSAVPTDLPDLRAVTAPLFADISSEYGLYPDLFTPLSAATTGVFYDPTGSVFRRTLTLPDTYDYFTDYVDTNGDGVTSWYLAHTQQDPILPDTLTDRTYQENGRLETLKGVVDVFGAVESTQGNAPKAGIPMNVHDLDGTILTGKTRYPNKPWDRIVSLRNIQVWMEPEDGFDHTTNKAQPMSAVTLADSRFAATNPDSVDALARIVLKGGFLPDYPEHDNIDNDGDGGYVLWEDCDCNQEDYPGQFTSSGLMAPVYVPGTLDKDMVDNNLNGLVDERGVGVDNNPVNWCFTRDGRRVMNPNFFIAARVNGPNTPPDASLSEGVDEGRYTATGSYLDALHHLGWGSGEAGVLPAVFFHSRNRAHYPSDREFELALSKNQILNGIPVQAPNVDPYGDYALRRSTTNPNPNPYLYTNTFSIPGCRAVAGQVGLAAWLGSTADPLNPSADFPALVRRFGDQVAEANAVAAGGTALGINGEGLYLGSDYDPPEWKEFVERRWNPGDNVIVTLYVGDHTKNQVADRVTYRELDVTNRTRDDVVACPYVTVNASGVTVRDSLNPNFPSMWKPDQMGLDFYRALERKDPFYKGDRFGTTNRWEATDGNYDDWADSPSFFVLDVDSTVFPYRAMPAFRYRFDAVLPPTGDIVQRDDYRLYLHAMFGSPLRMNLAARIWENPRDFVRMEASTYGYKVPVRYSVGDGDDRIFNQFKGREQLSLPTLVMNDPTAPLVADEDWSFGKAVVRNASLRSPADLMRLPHVMLAERLQNSARSLGIPASFLFSPMPVNRFEWRKDTSIPVAQDTSVRGATLGRDETDASLGQILSDTTDLMSNASVTLTVGQAEFVPIWPSPNGTPAINLPAGVSFTDLLDWQDTGTSAGVKAPAAWMPIFLFNMPSPIDAQPNSNLTQFPNYPSYPDGYNLHSMASGLTIPLRYLFDGDYILNQNKSTNAFIGTLNVSDWASRWPLEKRVAMYVSENWLEVQTKNPQPNGGYYQQPEAEFIWDADDGLENGEYYVYVNTFLPQLRDLMYKANYYSQCPAANNGSGREFLYDTSATDDTGYIMRKFLFPKNYPLVTGCDSVVPELLAPGEIFAPTLELEVITDPSKSRGYSDSAGQPGLVRPAVWYPTPAEVAPTYQPGLDGNILIGGKGADGWQPTVVRVTDRFLALRVRNVGKPGEIAAITGVTLAPRKRTPGRIDINTVENRLTIARSGGLKKELFNPLLGLPGVVNVLSSLMTLDPNSPAPIGVPLGPDDAYGPPPIATTDTEAKSPWPAPVDFLADGVNAGTMHPTIPPTRSTDGSDLLATGYSSDAKKEDEMAALRLTSLMMAGRPHHTDGRYYSNIADLVRDANKFYSPTDHSVVYPLSNEASAQRRFQEVMERFGRIANLITARSDVYQITATVQAGYGVDLNKDGWIDYRGNQEFITTAETKGTIVYERRSPSAQPDQPAKSSGTTP
jgi:hypothetical protein